MVAKRYLSGEVVPGQFKQVPGTQTSAGAANGGDFISAGDDGKLDSSWLPAGVSVAARSYPASEAIAANAPINVWSNAGVISMRNADATADGKQAIGFAQAAVASGATGTAIFFGEVTGQSGLVPGRVFLGRTAGTVTQDLSAHVTGNVVQQVGWFTSATSYRFGLSTEYIR